MPQTPTDMNQFIAALQLGMITETETDLVIIPRIANEVINSIKLLRRVEAMLQQSSTQTITLVAFEGEREFIHLRAPIDTNTRQDPNS